MPRRTPKRRSEGQEEQAFLDGYDPSAFDRPSVAVDLVLLTVAEGELRVLLIRRKEHPARGRWSLPGGFVGIDETLDAAAQRVVKSKAGLSKVFIEQLYTFGAVKRDPRARVISVSYYALVDAARVLGAFESADSDLSLARVDVPWEGETGGPVNVVGDADKVHALAFDHAEILGTAVKRIRGKLNYTPIGFQLLPATFTLRRLQTVHETILGRTLNKDAFRRRMLATGSLLPTGEREREVGHRPAELYRFTKESAL